MIKATSSHGTTQELRTQAMALDSIGLQLTRIGRKRTDAVGVYKKVICGIRVKIGYKTYHL